MRKVLGGMRTDAHYFGRLQFETLGAQPQTRNRRKIILSIMAQGLLLVVFVVRTTVILKAKKRSS